jgi:hypothetical protein
LRPPATSGENEASRNAKLQRVITFFICANAALGAVLALLAIAEHLFPRVQPIITEHCGVQGLI